MELEYWETPGGGQLYLCQLQSVQAGAAFDFQKNSLGLWPCIQLTWAGTHHYRAAWLDPAAWGSPAKVHTLRVQWTPVLPWPRRGARHWRGCQWEQPLGGIC